MATSGVRQVEAYLNNVAIYNVLFFQVLDQNAELDARFSNSAHSKLRSVGSKI